MASSAASGLLSRQLKLMQSDKDIIPGISCGLIGNNVFEWEVMLMISDDCKYYGGKEILCRFRCETGNSTEDWNRKGLTMCTLNNTGGFYRAHLIFPPEYPHLPPKMTFQTPIFHPNGTVHIQDPPPPLLSSPSPKPSPKTKQTLKQTHANTNTHSLPLR